ncbi:hypothetical protein HYS48_04640 [Candidatus Woesearchaeota archaeon]|nr:hypothetical protein [Candidatus Woesearchaeota archaeon]
MEVGNTHTLITSSGVIAHNCISVDPHYLLYKAETLGYHPKVILAGRDVNDYMPKYIAEMVVKELGTIGKPLKEAKVLVMGITFKEDVKDMRNSKIKLTIKELQEYGVTVLGCDPLLDHASVQKQFGIPLVSFDMMKEKVDCIIIAKKHKQFTQIPLEQYKEKMNYSHKPIMVDVAYVFTKDVAEKHGFVYKTL